MRKGRQCRGREARQNGAEVVRQREKVVAVHVGKDVLKRFCAVFVVPHDTAGGLEHEHIARAAQMAHVLHEV